MGSGREEEITEDSTWRSREREREREREPSVSKAYPVVVAMPRAK